MERKCTNHGTSVAACAVSVLTIILCRPVIGVTIEVPRHYGTIQEAINWAVDGDVIIVSPSTYYENISFRGKNITVRSVEPTSAGVVAATIIDGNRVGPVVSFSGTETSACILSGFTIQNGVATAGRGGGISGNRDNHPQAVIQFNVIQNNSTSIGGGGIAYCGGIIRNNRIEGNLSPYGGGGFYGCSATIEANVIRNNTAQLGGGGGVWLPRRHQAESHTGELGRRQGRGIADVRRVHCWQCHFREYFGCQCWRTPCLQRDNPGQPHYEQFLQQQRRRIS